MRAPEVRHLALALPLLWSRSMTMNEKQMFKVISPAKGKDDKTYWTRVGSAFRNKDDSINVYLDAFPKSFEFQIRELTEEDRQRREAARGKFGPRTGPAVEPGMFASRPSEPPV